MNHFYVSIIFIGITLIVVSLVWIAYDRKKSHDYAAQIDAKKNELVTIINDAEQMIEEMNKFSDYIVTQMETKNEEICSNLKTLDDRITQINHNTEEVHKVKELSSANEKVVSGNMIDMDVNANISTFNRSQHSDLVIENILNNYDRSSGQKTKDKVIPLNNKYKEVIQLAQNGVNDTEIAKSLKMGKGEVQLVLGINK